MHQEGTFPEYGAANRVAADPPAAPNAPRWHRSPAVLRAASLWRDACLLLDGSVFSAESLWTLAGFEALKRAYVDRPDLGTGDFFTKLKSQLADQGPEVHRLMAELLWVLYLSVSETSMHGETKRRQIRQVWEWSGAALPEAPEVLGDVLEEGVANPGTAYSTHRWREVAFAIELFIAWKKLSTDIRAQLLDHPWEFAEWVDRLPSSQGRQFRHMLTYLLFPDFFERAVTAHHKVRIVQAFREKTGADVGPVDYKDRASVDRALYVLRGPVAQRYGPQEFDYYLPPLKEVWQPDQEDDVESREEAENWYRERFGDRSVWMINAGERGRLWSDFQANNLVAIPWGELGDLREYASLNELRGALAGETGRIPTNDSLACWEFYEVMNQGDLVIAKSGRDEVLGYGVITSDYDFDENRSEYPHVRSVRWDRVGKQKLPESSRVASKALTKFDKYKRTVRIVIDLLDQEANLAAAGPIQGRSRGVPLAEAAADLFIDFSEFTQIVDALARKKNLILQGPPGTGKSFMSRRIAYALMGERALERIRMIQFHQAYAYEDFVQGWRPADGGGFERKDGVFHQFCVRAAADPDHDYVFIIDEINRGNLSKILGELMMLIEVDKRGEEFAIPLTYSKDEDEVFSVPENVYIVGMMNTADRSLAMVDYALRRRFAFFSLRPAFATEKFSNHLGKLGASAELIDRIVSRMTELNDLIREDHRNLGPGFEIGHSFFVPEKGEEAGDDTWYARVIREEIEPLLHEYWFDEPERVSAQVERLLR